MADFIEAAFNQLCAEAKESEPWYVSLMVRVPFYGGPEEGGWWGSDTAVVKSQKCGSEEEAEALAKRIVGLAEELTTEARKEFGRYCNVTMEWLEARGLDADYLPEPDGEESYYVEVSQGIPKGSQGCRYYS